MSLLQKRLIVILGIFLVAAAIFLLMVVTVSIVWPKHSAEVPKEQFEGTLERTLTGSILEWNTRESFFRIAVANEAVYSVFLLPDALVTEGGAAVINAVIDPLLPVTTEVIARPKGDEYDFDAKTVRIPALGDLSLEERAARLHLMNEMTEQ